MLGYLSQIEGEEEGGKGGGLGHDSGAIRHVTAILGHRWQVEEFSTATATARPPCNDTHRGRSANGCTHEDRLCK